jgi:hypothetical protein
MTGGDTKALNKMMEAGQLDPNEMLPKMAAYMEKMSEANNAYQIALGTSIVAQGRMNFQFEKFVGIFSKNGGEQGFAKIFNSLSDIMRDNYEMARRLGGVWNNLGDVFKRVVVGIDNIIGGFSRMARYFEVSDEGMAGIAGMALLLAARFGRIAAAAGILFLVLEDISVGLKGGESYTKDFLEFLQDNAWAEIGLKTTAFAVGLGLIASNLIKIAGGIAAVNGAGAAGGMVGGILSVIAKHPLIAALVAATIALNVAHSVYASKAEEHLEKVKSSADFPTSTAISNLQEKVTMDNLNRPAFDPYRTSSYNRLPGVNAPMMMVDKISISVDGGGDPQKTADLVLEKIKEYSSNAMKNLPVTE